MRVGAVTSRRECEWREVNTGGVRFWFEYEHHAGVAEEGVPAKKLRGQRNAGRKCLAKKKASAPLPATAELPRASVGCEMGVHG